jgi:hypothetical protein
VEIIKQGDAPTAMDAVGMGGRFFGLGGQVLAVPPPLRRRKAGSLEDLIAAVVREVEAVAGDAGMQDERPEVWVGPSGVTALWNGSDSRESIVFPLAWTAPWARLRAWAATPQLLEQRAFIRELTYTFNLDAALIAPWRKLDFLNAVKSAGEVAHGRDRLGREITAQATGTVDLPETIPVCVPVFEEMGERALYTAVCRVEIDAAANRVGLVPNPLELRAIEESHLRGVYQRLREGLVDDVPVYLGEVL